MKTKHLKAAAAAVSLLIASGPALALSTGPQTLGTSSVAVDVFEFTCPAGTFSARARVEDTVNIVNVPARMRVILEKVGLVTPVAQVEDTEGGGASPPAIRVGFSGLYRAMFLKTAGNPDSYVGTITCNDFAGAPAFTPTFDPLFGFPQQNQ